MAPFTAGIASDPYLGYMRRQIREDTFSGVDTDTFTTSDWMTPAEGSFETFRGFLLAGAIGLPIWAVILLLSWLIFS